MIITDEHLDELERLDKAATPGPWKQLPGWSSQILLSDNAEWFILCGKSKEAGHLIVDVIDIKNCEFIVAARTAVPTLVADVRRLRKELADERAQLRFIVDNQGAGSRTIVGRLLEEAQYLKENDIHPGIWRVLIIAAREIFRLTKELADGPYQHCTKRQEGGCVMLTENERLRAALTLLKKMTIDNPSVPDDVVKIIMSALAGELTQPEVDEMLAKLAEGGGK